MEHVASALAARAAIRMALTSDRSEERTLREELLKQGVQAAAADYGGEFNNAARKIIERAVVAAKREGVIKGTHSGEGAIAGATREALEQILPKALGLNVGGKVGIARSGEHLAVAVFFGVGLLHLDDVAVGLAHRAVSDL